MISSFPNPPKSSPSSPPAQSAIQGRSYLDHNVPRYDDRDISKPRVLPSGDPARYDYPMDSGSPGNERDPGRYVPIDMALPGIPSSLNLDDNIALHLAVETAIFDSSRFELMSSEQVDELKREHTSVTSRLEALKAKLALESKIRDAAISLGRLQSPQTKGYNHPQSHEPPDDEVRASSARCEAISVDIRMLDHQLLNIQRRLLRHTAGILGLTHNNNKLRGSKPNGSISSTHPFYNASAESGVRNSRQRPPEEFDDRSLYRSAEKLDEFQALQSGYGRNSLVSKKSSDRIHGKISSLRNSAQHHDQETINFAEKRLGELNNTLRGILSSGGSHRDLSNANQADSVRGSSLQDQLKALEDGIEQAKSVIEEQVYSVNKPNQEQDNLGPLWDVLRSYEANLAEISNQRGQGFEDEPEASNSLNGISDEGLTVEMLAQKLSHITSRYLRLRQEKHQLQDQLSQLEDQKDMEMQKTQDAQIFHEQQILGLTNSLSNTMNELSQVSSKQEGDAMQLKQDIAVLQVKLEEQKAIYSQQIASLQEEIVNRETDANSRLQNADEASRTLKAQLREQEEELLRLRDEVRDSEEIISSTKDRKQSERQELDALSAKLRDREENLSNLEERLGVAKTSYDSLSQKCDEQSKQLETMQRLVKDLESKLHDRDSAAKTLNARIDEHEAQREEDKSTESNLRLDISRLEEQIVDLKSEVEDITAELAATKAASQQEIDSVRKQAVAAVQAEQGKPKAAMDPSLFIELEQLSQKNEELSNANSQLQAELAEAREIAEREPKGGDGSLQDRCDSLQKELNEMLFDYEGLMKASVDSETERSRLESQIDGLQDKVEALEGHLADEKIKWLGNTSTSKNPAASINGATTPGISSGESVTISVLRAEFKKMMRDMRTEHNKNIRVEQEAKRKLESEIRQLRKDHQQLQKQNL